MTLFSSSALPASKLARIEDNDPEIMEKKKTPKIMRQIQKIYSTWVLPDMSP
jgi:hypothetical protein